MRFDKFDYVDIIFMVVALILIGCAILNLTGESCK